MKGPSRNWSMEKKRKKRTAAYTPLCARRCQLASKIKQKGRNEREEDAHPPLIPPLLEHVLRHGEVREQDEQRGERGEGYGFVEESVSGAREV
jgi:hypothetical protein